MEDEEEFCFTIYHMPVHFQAPVRGRERFLREREFLDNLVAPKMVDIRLNVRFLIRRRISICWTMTT